MSTFNDRPTFFTSDNAIGGVGEDEVFEILNDEGEWVEVFRQDMSDDEFEELKLRGRGFRPKRTKPSTSVKPGKPSGSGGGVKRVVSAANRIILENFVAPLAVGYIIDGTTGKKTLDHPPGSHENADGTVTYQNGSVAQPDNSIKHANGSVTQPGGDIITYPEGEEGGGTFNLKTGLRVFSNGDTAQGTKEGGKWKFPPED